MLVRGEEEDLFLVKVEADQALQELKNCRQMQH